MDGSWKKSRDRLPAYTHTCTHTFKCASYICKSEAQRVYQGLQISCPSHALTLVALATFKGRVLIQANKWSINSPFIHDRSLLIQVPLQYFHFILPLVWLHRVEGKLVNPVQNCQMEEEAWSFPKLNADPKAGNKSYKSVNIKLLIIHKSLPSFLWFCLRHRQSPVFQYIRCIRGFHSDFQKLEQSLLKERKELGSWLNRPSWGRAWILPKSLQDW